MPTKAKKLDSPAKSAVVALTVDNKSNSDQKKSFDVLAQKYPGMQIRFATPEEIRKFMTDAAIAESSNKVEVELQLLLKHMERLAAEFNGPAVTPEVTVLRQQAHEKLQFANKQHFNKNFQASIDLTSEAIALLKQIPSEQQRILDRLYIKVCENQLKIPSEVEYARLLEQESEKIRKTPSDQKNYDATTIKQRADNLFVNTNYRDAGLAYQAIIANFYNATSLDENQKVVQKYCLDQLIYCKAALVVEYHQVVQPHYILTYLTSVECHVITKRWTQAKQAYEPIKTVLQNITNPTPRVVAQLQFVENRVLECEKHLQVQSHPSTAAASTTAATVDNPTHNLRAKIKQCFAYINAKFAIIETSKDKDQKLIQRARYVRDNAEGNNTKAQGSTNLEQLTAIFKRIENQKTVIDELVIESITKSKKSKLIGNDEKSLMTTKVSRACFFSPPLPPDAKCQQDIDGFRKLIAKKIFEINKILGVTIVNKKACLDPSKGLSRHYNYNWQVQAVFQCYEKDYLDLYRESKAISATLPRMKQIFYELMGKCKVLEAIKASQKINHPYYAKIQEVAAKLKLDWTAIEQQIPILTVDEFEIFKANQLRLKNN